MPDIDLDFPRDIREVLIPRVHERLRRRPLGPRRRLPDLPPARRRARPRQGAGAAAGGDRAGGEDGRLPRARGRDRARRRRRDRRRAGRLAALAGAAASSAAEAMGLPRHASQHPGGMVISTRPLIDVCPVVPAAMEGRQIVQWDKDSCADAGFLKIDLLGLGMLSAVERCVDEIARTRGERIDLSRIPLDDRETFESIRAAETTGVFQIESRAQMQMLPRTRPREPRRPHRAGGAGAAGADPGRRRPPLYRAAQAAARGPRATRSPTSTRCWSRCCADTLGTIVFQEQVIEVAMALAGFSSAEAEGLRRAMSRKRSEEAIARSPRALRRRRRGERGVSAGGGRAGLGADPGLLRLRLPEGALGRLRPARLPVGLAARPLRARVPLRAAERAADGLLPARLARPRGAAARRPGAPAPTPTAAASSATSSAGAAA